MWKPARQTHLLVDHLILKAWVSVMSGSILCCYIRLKNDLGRLSTSCFKDKGDLCQTH